MQHSLSGLADKVCVKFHYRLLTKIANNLHEMLGRICGRRYPRSALAT